MNAFHIKVFWICATVLSTGPSALLSPVILDYFIYTPYYNYSNNYNYNLNY